MCIRDRTSNLRSEITLHTGIDHRGMERTGVCCSSSVNLEYFDDWRSDEQFIADVTTFLDNVIQVFIDRSELYKGFEHSRYSAMRERSVGLGVMGFHYMLQKKSMPFESEEAKAINKEIFKHISDRSKETSIDLANKRGACPDMQEAGINERLTHVTAIAPTATISIVTDSSPSIDPITSNVINHKSLSGTYEIKNRVLKERLASMGQDTMETWQKIRINGGSVSALTFLTKHEKDVFKTAFEIDQSAVVNLAADRVDYICQAQSVNLFFEANAQKKEVGEVHYLAWKKGLKSLYYYRSMGEKVSNECSVCQ